MGSGRGYFRWRVRDQLVDTAAVGYPQKEAKEQERTGLRQSIPGRGACGADASEANWQGGGQWERGATQVARHSPVGAFRGSVKDLDFISTDTGRHWRG